MTETLTGTDRSAGISYDELFDNDTHPVSEALRRVGEHQPGNTRVPAPVYYAQDVHDLEVERLWGRVWQLACLEEEIPEVGDYHVYDIAHLSFLVIRTGPDEIKAYRNACLHRGRKLREHHGRGASSLRCPFHGWCWELDGSMKEIPCQWDFPDVDMADYGLPEALVGTWHGFVFINPDRNATPLADYLGDLADHFEFVPFERRFKAAHVSKLMPMNWKTCQEAFMESYHVVATHPTLMESLGDANSRYDVFGNYSRAMTATGVPSPHLDEQPRWERIDDGKEYGRWRHPMSGHIYERDANGHVAVTDLDGNLSTFDEDGNHLGGLQTQADPHLCKWIGGPLPPGFEEMPLMTPHPPPEVTNVRGWLADRKRAQVQRQVGDALDVEAVSDAEMIDSIFFSVFPNWSPWGCFNPIMYRFRPNGDNPQECIFEVMLFPPAPAEGAARPAPAKVRHLGFDDDWTLAPELGPLAKIFQQDSLNLPLVQKGLRAQEQQEVIFASYQETKIRHFYQHYFEALGSRLDRSSGAVAVASESAVRVSTASNGNPD
ncbi:aromatic ring-hydroxylating oxygenase subunit alpha [Candidatus Poriferisodalis sp.]|uniref:aromatic ring-hydroxylating oxygenase subunit alpha n=1 Tax=Candidatus Poriferisodalis sp. TaxID=3101277 RepID=UPI003B0160DA